MDSKDTSQASKERKTRRSSSRSSSRAEGRSLALSVHSGLLEGAFFPLTRKHNVIGRKVNAHIPIKDAKVSREHAAITNSGGDYVIRDLGSTNGTFVNNERVEEPIRLSVGDKIRIGAYTFRVEPVVQRKDTELQKWSSETKVLFRSPSLLMPVEQDRPSRGPKVVRKKETSLSQVVGAFMKYQPTNFLGRLNQEKLKWMILAIGVLVILAATMTGRPVLG